MTWRHCWMSGLMFLPDRRMPDREPPPADRVLGGRPGPWSLVLSGALRHHLSSRGAWACSWAIDGRSIASFSFATLSLRSWLAFLLPAGPWTRPATTCLLSALAAARLG